MITVSTHALLRFRERVHPDASDADVLAAWHEAHPVHPDVVRIGHRRRHSVFRQHPHGFLLVARRKRKNGPARLITVLCLER